MEATTTSPLKSPTTARRKLLSNLFPRKPWTPSQWAENCRVLTKEESNQPGPYTFDVTPFWKDVIDAAAEPTVEEIVVLKGAQVGWSETCRNLAGFWVDLDPGPIMVLAPDEVSADAFRAERIEPLIQNTPAVRRHVSHRKWDSTKHRIKFDSCSMFFAWAGSKTGTKSRPIRRLIAEEPDEYPPFSSTGGDPLSKAEKRLTTYRSTGRSTLLLGGTPTTRQGNVWKRWELCSARFYFWVPCPHCKGYQTLVWGKGKGGPGVKWPELGEVERRRKAEAIKVGHLAFYQCHHCGEAIRDHHKPGMLKAGLWASEDQAVTQDGRVVGPKPVARRVGYVISQLYSPWVTFSEMAADWLESQGDPNKLADFVNQVLAEPFEEQRAKLEPTLYEAKARNGPPPMVVPRWTRWLIATADTQGDDEKTGYFWYVIRAWGCEYRSQLVDFGICHSKAELTERCLNRPIPLEGGTLSVCPTKQFTDTGGKRWNEIYQMAQSDDRVVPTKGASTSRMSLVEERPQKDHNIVLWYVDTAQAKDHLHRLINDPDLTLWALNSAVNADYCSQMSSEAKIFDPRKKKEKWVEVVKNNNHLWDCEVTQAAAAWRLGAGAPEPLVVEESGTSQVPTTQTGSWATGYRGQY